MLHISASKSVHIYTFAAQICMVSIVLDFIFLIFLSLHLSQSSSLPTDFLSSFVKLILNLQPKLIKLPIVKSIKNHQKPILQRRRRRTQKKKKMKWRRRRELRTHLLVWPVVLAPFLTESCVGERFWVQKIREGNGFLSFSLLFFFFLCDIFTLLIEEAEGRKKKNLQRSSNNSIEREQIWWERRESLNENNNKKKKENDYLNKREYRINKLIWVIYKSDVVK